MGSFWRTLIPWNGAPDSEFRREQATPVRDALVAQQPESCQAESTETQPPQVEELPCRTESLTSTALAGWHVAETWVTLPPDAAPRPVLDSNSQQWRRPMQAAGDDGLTEGNANSDTEEGVDSKGDPYMTLNTVQLQMSDTSAHQESTLETQAVKVQVEHIANNPGAGLSSQAAGGSSAVRRFVEVQVETLAPVSAPAQKPVTEEGSWRVRHERSDVAHLPTALRPWPDPAVAPLQDTMAMPREEVLVLRSQRVAGPPNFPDEEVWVCIACATGEGWLKGCHLREGGYHMLHKRSDLALTPTALRDRPTARAVPSEAVKVEPDEAVLVHVQVEVSEGGRQTIWARIACTSGEGWLKREHLQEVVFVTSTDDEFIEDGASAAPGTPPMEEEEPVGVAQTEPQLAATEEPAGSPRSAPQPSAPDPSSGPQWWSKIDENPGHGSNSTPRGVRARLGTLEFVASSVSNLGLFDKVGFRASAQLGGFLHSGGPPAQWVDGGPATEVHSLQYARAVSEDGRYEAKVVCEFDDAFDLPLPQALALPDQLSVDIWLERTSVVDRFDQVLGTLGLHSPAGIDRHWLGRAVVNLPKDVDDIASPCFVIGGADVGPLPKVIWVGVEWVMEPLDQD